MFLRAVCAEKASTGTGLTVCSDCETLATDFAIIQLTRVRPLLLVHHCICQGFVIIVRLPGSPGLAAGEFLALFDLLDGLLSLALLGFVFGGLWIGRRLVLSLFTVNCSGFFLFGGLERRIRHPAVIVIADLSGGDVIRLNRGALVSFSKQIARLVDHARQGNQLGQSVCRRLVSTGEISSWEKSYGPRMFLPDLRSALKQDVSITLSLIYLKRTYIMIRK